MAKFGYMKVPLASMVAMVMCIITITALWLQVPLAAAQQFTLSADAREFLEAHNQLRANARVANLVWNDSLAAVAKSFVEQQCASLAPCSSSSSSAQGVPTYSSGQNSWCIVANANPQPTSASQTVATSSRWVTSRFASYDEDHHEHCDGEEGEGEEEGGGSKSSGATVAGPVAGPAPGPVSSASAPVPVSSGFARDPTRSITRPPTPLVRPVRPGFPMPPPYSNYDASGNTGTDSSPTPGSGSGGSGVDATPTPGSGSGSNGVEPAPPESGSSGGGVGAAPTPAPLIVPGTGSSSDGEEGEGEEEGEHHCHREEDGEGEGGSEE